MYIRDHLYITLGHRMGGSKNPNTPLLIKMVPKSILYETIIYFELDNQSILSACFLSLIPMCTATQSVLKSAYYECPLLHVLCQPLQFWLNLIITSLVQNRVYALFVILRVIACTSGEVEGSNIWLGGRQHFLEMVYVYQEVSRGQFCIYWQLQSCKYDLPCGRIRQN